MLPAGTPGEIRVRGWSLMKGYYNMPEATAKTIDAAGWLHTGDLGVADEQGRICFIDRLKDMLRVGGENVAPADVEGVLHAHPAVELAKVVGVPDPRLVEVVAAYVVRKAGATVDPGGADRLVQGALRRLQGPALRALRRFLRRHRHDGELQDPAQQAARIRAIRPGPRRSEARAAVTRM